MFACYDDHTIFSAFCGSLTRFGKSLLGIEISEVKLSFQFTMWLFVCCVYVLSLFRFLCLFFYSFFKSSSKINGSFYLLFFYTQFEQEKMKRASRVAIIVTIFFFHLYFASFYLENILKFWYQFSTPTSSPGYQKYVVPAWMNATDKAVVMAKMEKENTDWVTKFLPE